MIPLLATSQNGYPKILLVNNDTIVGFTKTQARTLDGYRVDLNEKTEKEKFFKKRVSECENLRNKSIIYSRKLERENLMCKKLDTLSQKQIVKLNDDLAKSNKSGDRKSSTIKILGGSLATTILIITGMLIF